MTRPSLEPAASSMQVYLVPLGGDRHELYCEVPDHVDQADGNAQGGFIGRQAREFRRLLARAERDRQRSARAGRRSWARRLRDRALRWVAQSIAEQRLLWHLRSQAEVVLVVPDDLPIDDALGLMRSSLRRDAERHRFWLVFHGLGFAVSGVFALIPGPNLLAYFFAFRMVGHYLSRRGARHGLDRVAWQPHSSAALAELRQAPSLSPATRRELVRDVASRLQLRHLATFVERTMIRPA